MSAADSKEETLVVWAGEWPYVKRGVSQVRATTFSAARSVSRLFDLPGYMTMARKYANAADHFMTSRASRASANLQRNQWVLPATGVTVTSLFVVAKSAPWGGYVMLRNGMITAALLTVFLFPREIVASVDALLPFSLSKIDPPPKTGGLDEPKSAQSVA